MTNHDVPVTDAQVEETTDTATDATTTEPTAPEADAPAEAAPTAPVVITPAPAPKPRGGNSQWADAETREQVRQFMAVLRDAGYTRPELQHYSGFNDSTVWRAQNGKVHTAEVDTWMTRVFGPFTQKTLPPPNAAARKPKVEDLEAKIAELTGEHDAKVQRALEALATEANSVKAFRALVEQVAQILRDEAPEPANA